MPTISVIVPVYKVEKYLHRCIDSILRQSFDDFELILIDDGSPDHCGDICDEYAAKDRRIRVIHQENAKLSAARNAGMNIAEGTWIALIDSDDWVHRDYLKLLMSGALADTDVVICNCLITANDTEQDQNDINCAFQSISLKTLEAKHMVCIRVWGKLYRNRSIGDLRFIPGSEPAEDSCFNELFYRQDMKFRITNEKLYYYYMRPDSAIHSHQGRGQLNAAEALLSKLNGIDDAERQNRITSRCLKYIFSARYGEMFSNDYSDVKTRCKKLLKQLSPYISKLGAKNQIIMRTLAASPLLYRAWRISDDHTLIEYEKKQKRLKRERQAIAQKRQ